MSRREFVKGAAVGAGGSIMMASTAYASMDEPLRPHAAYGAAQDVRVSTLTKPVAITMWDFTWLERHYPSGEFWDWDAALDGLVERGYNAIRMDVFPHRTAMQPYPSKGFYLPRHDWHPVMWGNQHSCWVDPRDALLEFLPKCIERGIHLGLSTWWMGPGAGEVEGLDGFVRMWDDTLRFLDEHELLTNILYVDLLNEYPFFHGFSWFTNHVAALKGGGEEEAVETGDGENAHILTINPGAYNRQQQLFCRRFIDDAIDQLSAKWPGLDFFASLTMNGSVPYENLDYSRFAAFDMHIWMVHNGNLPEKSGYWEQIHSQAAPNDLKFADVNAVLLRNWRDHEDTLTTWMDTLMGQFAAHAEKHNLALGSTEGWGTVCWLDHPALDWTIIKEAGEICAELGVKHGYAFNCTSNFTHPHFRRLWEDVAWHKQVTSVIRSGTVAPRRAMANAT